MKKLKYILVLTLIVIMSSCLDLDVPPLNVVQDKDIFSSEAGIRAYMARMYSQLPVEDFRYTTHFGFNQSWAIAPVPGLTGEALCRDLNNARRENFDFWFYAYQLIREANYFIETLPTYRDNFSEGEADMFLGEAYFIRGFTYFAMAKRFGGVPLVIEVLDYPEQSIEELQMPRSSEEATYDLISQDFDKAIELLSESNQRGRANKYAAAGFKARAMLFAGSIAKFNSSSLFDDNNNRLVGIPESRANDFFKQSYEAAKMLEGKYSLYKGEWKAGDKEAQYNNFVNIFFAENSPETIFVKDYQIPETVHGHDSYHVPLQLIGPNGYSSGINPTLNFVEMFDGIPKDAEGNIKVVDENGKYIMFDKRMDLFADAEPRLRATVIFPGDEFKGVQIDIRRGIYTNPDVANGINRFPVPEGSQIKYEEVVPAGDLVTSGNQSQTAYTLANGERMNPAGLSGPFHSDIIGTLSGFSVRKLLDPDLSVGLTLERRLDQPWIEMRYAEVLLTRSEAAMELSLAGESDANYLQDAYEIINTIRERAGADLLASSADLTRDIVRKERRKELAFENKIWWDLKRWRIIHEEQNATIWRVLMPFYAEHADKYFFDARLSEDTWIQHTFDNRWYYEPIPGGEITKSPNLIQNPGY